ncbi:hypothetical protein Hanom_Chr03g00213231 [Helianthus anomalus]
MFLVFFKRINNNKFKLICEGRSNLRIFIIILNLGLTMKLKRLLYFRRENRFLDSLIDCHVFQIGLLYYMYRFSHDMLILNLVVTLLVRLVIISVRYQSFVYQSKEICLNVYEHVFYIGQKLQI